MPRSFSLGSTGRPDEANQTFRVLLRFWSGLDAPLEIVSLHERLAKSLRAAGDSVSAALEVEEAKAVRRKAGAVMRAESCAARVR